MFCSLSESKIAMHRRRSALNRVWLLFIIFSVAYSVALPIVVGQGGDCSPLVQRDLGDFDSLNQTGLISMALPSQPAVQLLNYSIVCIAQGTMKDTWRMVSGVATYMLAGGMVSTMQFHFQCDSDSSAWNPTILNSTEFVLTNPNATFDTMARTDCALCASPEQVPEADNDQHCVSCASECNATGLMRCTSQASTDCCTHFGPERQCINESSCPGNSVPSETFECICPSNYTGAECTVDINECEVDTDPCENGANCTNTDGSFICNCTADWSGTRCDVCILENCANCTANENQSFAAICIQCEDGYQLENETCRPICLVEGCMNCSQNSSTICEECESGLTRAENGSSCSAMTTLVPTTGPSMASSTAITSAATSTAASTGNSTGRLAGIVAGSVVGGLLLILLVAVIIGATVCWRRKKSRVTLTFDLDTMKATHVSGNPVFEDIGREDSGIENDDEITVNKGALEFEDD